MPNETSSAASARPDADNIAGSTQMDLALIDPPGDAAHLGALARPEELEATVAAIDTPVAPEWSFGRLIGTSTAVKFVSDTSTQFLSPYLPLIVAGLGTSLVVGGRLTSLYYVMGMASPFFAMLADKRGYRWVLAFTILLSAGGLAVVGVSPSVVLAGIGFIIFGLGRGAFNPILQSYLSTKLPYHLRARGLGIIEYAWALSGIIGLFGIGLLIEATSWRAPFLLLAVLLVAGAWVVLRLPPTHHADTAIHADGEARSFVERTRDYFDFGPTALSTWATIGVGSLIFYSGVQFFVVYGAWLTDSWGFNARQLGTAALVLGLFDLAASVGVSLFTDRFGKWRSVLLGAIVAIVGYLLLSRLAFSATWAVLALGLPRIGFEFAVVAYFPLLSEQAPAVRSKVMSIGAAVMLLFATIAGFVAPALFLTWGIGGVAVVSALTCVAGIALLLLFSRERGGVVGQ
jgi:predicted MFS family arabinose efflux permease